MGNSRRNPFRGFVDTLSETNRARERWMTGNDAGGEDRRRDHTTAWIPTTDIFAQGDDLVIRAELAGVSEEDVDLTISSGMLTISGDRKIDLDEDQASYYVRERFYGVFRRDMTLPEGIDESRIHASFKNGLLLITVKDGAIATKPRHVQIQTDPG